MTGLQVDQLHVFRGERHVLRGLSFQASAGVCVQVTGANGAGKTTLLRALVGLVESESGRIAWRGADVAADRSAFHRDVAYLGHDAPLKADLTGLENLRYAAGIRRRLQAGDYGPALERVGARRFADRPVRTLSAGQRRRIALAWLWLAGAPLWILDEPNTNLDAAGQQLVASLVEEQVGGGGIVIAAVHQPLRVTDSRLQPLELGGVG